MDLSAVIVIIVLTVLFFGAIIWLGIHSRRTKPNETSSDPTEAG